MADNDDQEEFLDVEEPESDSRDSVVSPEVMQAINGSKTGSKSLTSGSVEIPENSVTVGARSDGSKSGSIESPSVKTNGSASVPGSRHSNKNRETLDETSKSHEVITKSQELSLSGKQSSLDRLGEKKETGQRTKIGKWQRQCNRQFRAMIGKREMKNEELERQQGDLRERLNILECSMPAVMVWNIWRMTQGANAPCLQQILEKQFQGPASGEAYCPTSPSRHFDCRVREAEAERKQARMRVEEARTLWAEKMANLEDREKRLQEARQLQEEQQKRIEQLTSEVQKLREARTNDDDGACEAGECGVIECKRKWLEKVPSSASIRSTDIECLEKLQELAEAELCMKRQIADLERREDAYMKTLQQADELWNCIEGDGAGTIQEQLEVKTNRIAELEDELQSLRSKMATCRAELEKYVSIGKIEALIGRDDDFADVTDKEAAAVVDMVDGMTPLGEGIVSLGEGITSLGEGITSLGEGITSMGDGITPLGEGITSLGEGITSLGEGITTLGEGMTPLGKSVDDERSGAESGGHLSGKGPSVRPEHVDIEETTVMDAKYYLAQLGSLSELDDDPGTICGPDFDCNDLELSESGLPEDEKIALEENRVTAKELLEKYGLLEIAEKMWTGEGTQYRRAVKSEIQRTEDGSQKEGKPLTEEIVEREILYDEKEGVDDRLKDDEVEMGEVKVEMGEVKVEMGEVKVEMEEVKVEMGEVKVEMEEVKVEMGQDEDEVGKDEVEVGEDDVEVGEDDVGEKISFPSRMADDIVVPMEQLCSWQDRVHAVCSRIVNCGNCYAVYREAGIVADELEAYTGRKMELEEKEPIPKDKEPAEVAEEIGEAEFLDVEAKEEERREREPALKVETEEKEREVKDEREAVGEKPTEEYSRAEASMSAAEVKSERLAEEKEAITVQKEKLAEKEEAITVQKGKVAEEEEAITVKKEKVAEEEEAITVKKDKVAEEEEAIIVKKDKVAEEEEAIIVKKEKVADEEKAITVKKDKVAEEEEAIIVKKEKVADEEKAITVKKDKVAEEEEAIIVKKEKVAEEEEAIIVKKEKVAEEEEEAAVTVAKEKVAQKEEAITAKEEKVAEEKGAVTAEKERIEKAEKEKEEAEEKKVPEAKSKDEIPSEKEKAEKVPATVKVEEAEDRGPEEKVPEPTVKEEAEDRVEVVPPEEEPEIKVEKIEIEPEEAVPEEDEVEEIPLEQLKEYEEAIEVDVISVEEEPELEEIEKIEKIPEKIVPLEDEPEKVEIVPEEMEEITVEEVAELKPEEIVPEEKEIEIDVIPKEEPLEPKEEEIVQILLEEEEEEEKEEKVTVEVPEMDKIELEVKVLEDARVAEVDVEIELAPVEVFKERDEEVVPEQPEEIEISIDEECICDGMDGAEYSAVEYLFPPVEEVTEEESVCQCTVEDYPPVEEEDTGECRCSTDEPPVQQEELADCQCAIGAPEATPVQKGDSDVCKCTPPRAASEEKTPSVKTEKSGVCTCAFKTPSARKEDPPFPPQQAVSQRMEVTQTSITQFVSQKTTIQAVTQTVADVGMQAHPPPKLQRHLQQPKIATRVIDTDPEVLDRLTRWKRSQEPSGVTAFATSQTEKSSFLKILQTLKTTGAHGKLEPEKELRSINYGKKSDDVDGRCNCCLCGFPVQDTVQGRRPPADVAQDQRPLLDAVQDQRPPLDAVQGQRPPLDACRVSGTPEGTLRTTQASSVLRLLQALPFLSKPTPGVDQGVQHESCSYACKNKRRHKSSRSPVPGVVNEAKQVQTTKDQEVSVSTPSSNGSACCKSKQSHETTMATVKVQKMGKRTPSADNADSRQDSAPANDKSEDPDRVECICSSMETTSGAKKVRCACGDPD